MTVALIIVAAALAVAVGGCIAFGVRASNAADRAALETSLRVAAERDRDFERARAEKMKAERDAAITQLVKTQKAAVAVGKESVEHVRTEAAATDATGVVGILNGVLGADLSGAGDPDDGAS